MQQISELIATKNLLLFTVFSPLTDQLGWKQITSLTRFSFVQYLSPMSARKTVCLLALLLSAPFLTLGQKVVQSELVTKGIDLSNKTFMIGEERDTSKAGNDLHLFFLFYKDGNAMFRAKIGNTIIQDSPISWQFTGDSLCLKPGPI